MPSPHGPEQGPSSLSEDILHAPLSGARTVGSRVHSLAKVLGMAQGGQTRRALGRLGLLPLVLISPFIDYQGPVNSASANVGDPGRTGQTVSLDPPLVSNHSPKAENLSNPEVITHTEYNVLDLVVFGESHVASLVKTSTGQYLAVGELDPTNPNNPLELIIKGKIPFNGSCVFASDDGSIIGVGGSEAPGVDKGKLWLMVDGQGSILDQDKGTVFDGGVTADKKYVITREADPTQENGSGYFVRDLATLTVRFPLVSSVGALGAIQGPIIPVNPSAQSVATIYKSFGSGWSTPGYAETTFDLNARTTSVNLFHPEEGYNMSRRLTQYTNAQGKQVVGIINNMRSVFESKGERRLGIFYYNEGSTHIPGMDRRPQVSLYPDATDIGDGLNSVVITAVAADVEDDRLFLFTSVNIDNKLLPHIEVTLISDPTAPHVRVDENGTWSEVAKSGDPNHFGSVIERVGEKYLLADNLSDQSSNNGLRLKRITNGINNSADVFKTVPVRQLIYKRYLSIYQQGAKQ